MTVEKETFVTPFYEVKGFSPTEKLFVMTDLHGCSQAMSRLLKHYDGSSKVVFLGDAIDRGPDSYGVVKTLLELDALCILGNHEFMSLEALYPETVYYKNWAPLWHTVNGGDKTLDSFEKAIAEGADYIENRNKIRFPKIYDDYIRRCQSHYLCGNYLFSHAGIPAHEKVKLCENPFDPENFDDTFLWRRPKTAFDQYRFEPRIFNDKEVFSVSGHTPMPPHVIIQNYGVELDTGHMIKLAMEIHPDDNQTNSKYRIIGTICTEVRTPWYTLEQVQKSVQKETILKEI